MFPYHGLTLCKVLYVFFNRKIILEILARSLPPSWILGHRGANYWSGMFQNASIRFLMFENYMLAFKIFVLSTIGKKLTKPPTTMAAILDFRPQGRYYWSELFMNASIQFLMFKNYMVAFKIFVLSAIGKKLTKPPTTMTAILDFRP